MDDLRRLFGFNVRRLRKKLGFSQEGLALACGLDRTYVGSVERGERNISLINIGKMAKALRVAPSHLLTFRANKSEGFHLNARRTKKSPRKS